MKKVFKVLGTEFLSFSVFMNLIVVICGNVGAIMLVLISNHFWFNFILIIGVVHTNIIVAYSAYIDYVVYKKKNH